MSVSILPSWGPRPGPPSTGTDEYGDGSRRNAALALCDWFLSHSSLAMPMLRVGFKCRYCALRTTRGMSVTCTKGGGRPARSLLQKWKKKKKKKSYFPFIKRVK